MPPHRQDRVRRAIACTAVHVAMGVGLAASAPLSGAGWRLPIAAWLLAALPVGASTVFRGGRALPCPIGFVAILLGTLVFLAPLVVLLVIRSTPLWIEGHF